MASLPSVIPVFPLPNVVLFPRVQLPLHIFEPRYRQMVRDAVGKERPLIGMALLRGNWRENYQGNPEIFPVGCVGAMVRVAPLADGRFNIFLQGVREYRIREEIFHKPYREAVVEWRPERKERLLRDQRQELCRLLEVYLPQSEAVQRLLADPAIEDELFVNFFAFHLDLPPIEKQSLLEAETLPERATYLRDILDFRLTETRWRGGGEGKSNKPWVH